MVKEIIWSNEIVNDIEEVLQYWAFHNKSNVYSDRLLSEVFQSVDLIQKIPTIGNPTNNPFVRGKIVAYHFYIFYEITFDKIILIRFWDGRRNPESIKF